MAPLATRLTGLADAIERLIDRIAAHRGQHLHALGGDSLVARLLAEAPGGLDGAVLILLALSLVPPSGFAVCFLRSVAPPAVATADIYRGMLPIIAIQVAVLGLVWAWPQIATRLLA